MLDGLRRRLSRRPADVIQVHLIVKGKIGAGWYDVDERIPLRAGATLGRFLDETDRRGLGVRAAIAASPHLEHTLMLNGERCPVAVNLDRVLMDDDQIYLLSPLAGG